MMLKGLTDALPEGTDVPWIDDVWFWNGVLELLWLACLITSEL